ncbi:hypothetical protein pb186bvf_010671 [Paramecium bursaria]
MSLIVKLVDRKNCYIGLPAIYLASQNISYQQGRLCKPFRLTNIRSQQEYVFGYIGTQSDENTIQFGHVFASLNDIQENDLMNIENVQLEETKQLQLFVKNMNDYISVQQFKQKIEEQLINNIQIISQNLFIPIYYNQSQYVIFKYKNNSCLLNVNAELDIQVEEMELQKQQIIPLQVKIIKTGKNIIYISKCIQAQQNDIHQIRYNNNHPKLITNCQQMKKLKKERKLKLYQRIIQVQQKNEDSQYIFIDELYAKYLKLSHGQYVDFDTVPQKQYKNINLRELKISQLIEQQIVIKVYCDKPVDQQAIIQLLDNYVINRYYNIKNQLVYIKIEQKIKMEYVNIEHCIIINDCDDDRKKEVFQQCVVYSQQSLRDKNQYKYKKYSKLVFLQPCQLYFQLNSHNIQQIQLLLEQKKQLIITYSQNHGIDQYLNYIRNNYKVFKVNLQKCFQLGQVELMKQYIKLQFQQANNYKSLIVFKNNKIIRDISLIDTQQTQQLLISQMVSKFIDKQVEKHNVYVIFLTDIQLMPKYYVYQMQKPTKESRIQQLQYYYKQEEINDLISLTNDLEYIQFKSIQLKNGLQDLNEILPNSRQINKIPQFRHIGGFIKQKETVLDIYRIPLQHPELFLQFKIPKNILLYGMPGSGKSYFAQAICNQLNLNVLQVKGPELLDKYIGGSEHKVRQLFEQAASISPCIIFFDEFDSIVPIRSSSNSGVTDRVVNQFLCYLDGVEENLKNVFVIAASSRPDLIDPALLRPGRIDKHIFLDYPTVEEIQEIIQIYKGPLKFNDFSIEELSYQLQGLSQADIVSYLKEIRIQIADREIQITDLRQQKKECSIQFNINKIDLPKPVNMMDEYQFLFKFVLVGDSGTGKSCFLSQYINGTFLSEHNHTVGVEFESKAVQLQEGITIQNQVWDTAGAEDYRALARNFLKNSAAVIYLYDITKRETFESLNIWYERMKPVVSEQIQIVIIGTHKDKETLRQVKSEEGQQLAKNIGAYFQEMSLIHDKEQVDVIVDGISSNILRLIKQGKIDCSNEIYGVKPRGKYEEESQRYHTQMEEEIQKSPRLISPKYSNQQSFLSQRAQSPLRQPQQQIDTVEVTQKQINYKYIGIIICVIILVYSFI